MRVISLFVVAVLGQVREFEQAPPPPGAVLSRPSVPPVQLPAPPAKPVPPVAPSKQGPPVYATQLPAPVYPAAQMQIVYQAPAVCYQPMVYAMQTPCYPVAHHKKGCFGCLAKLRAMFHHGGGGYCCR
jgi:hypothetical protein